MIKRRWRLIGIALALAAMAVMFVSCSDDDDDDDDSGVVENYEDHYNEDPTYDVATARGKVLSYLHSMQAEGKTLTGQMDLTWDDSVDMDAKVYSAVSKHPAIMGYDFMNELVSDSWSGKGQTEEAISWWQAGGLVTFCWHWRDPSNKSGDFNAGDGTGGTTAFRIPYSNGALDTTSAAWTAMKADMDAIAVELGKLKSAGVPVLWRQLHEAYGNKDDWGGAWFWWGAGTGTTNGKGANRCAAYLALYKWMHDYYEDTKGLDNLIWVWNGQDASWYPGDDYCDVAGFDFYQNDSETASGYQSRVDETLTMLSSAAGDKVIAITENGPIPSPLKRLNNFAYFMTWNDHTSDDTQNFWSNTSINSLSWRQEVYDAASVITRDELPDWSTYTVQ